MDSCLKLVRSFQEKKIKTETTAWAIVSLNLNSDLQNKMISFSPIIVTNGLQN